MTFHNYVFFSSDKGIFDVKEPELEKYRKEFLEVLENFVNVTVYSYTMLGFKKEINLLLWFQSDSLESIQDVLKTLLHTQLGKYLNITHTLLGISRQSFYANSSNHGDTTRKGGKYLIIYPFTKTQEWYTLAFQTRKDLMKGHIAIGRKFPQISQILLYAYGIDDCEFIVSYETDNLLEFQQLVMELRTDKVRAYTLKDTPIFTCIYRTFAESVTYL